MQLELALLPSVEGVQAKLVSCVVGERLSVVVGLTEPVPAVIVALWVELTCAAAAVKDAEVCPELTVTLAGTVKLELLDESATVNAEGAEVFNDTVHGVLPGVLIVLDVQETEET